MTQLSQTHSLDVLLARMTQLSQTHSLLLAREVLPGEIDQDPKHGPAEVGAVLQMFVDAVRGGRDHLATVALVSIASDADLMTEVLFAAARDYGIEVDE